MACIKYLAPGRYKVKDSGQGKPAVQATVTNSWKTFILYETDLGCLIRQPQLFTKVLGSKNLGYLKLGSSNQYPLDENTTSPTFITTRAWMGI